MKHLRQWHWVSAALCLVGMLLFAATGITLNHAGDIEAKARRVTVQGELPAALRGLLDVGKGPVPGAVAAWMRHDLGVDVARGLPEWSDDELYIALPRPGGDGWASISRRDGAVLYEVTDRGWVALANDLHKGRGTGAVWSWFIDIFAGACVIFTVTGLFLLHFSAGNRPSTWPLVGVGLAVPLVLLILVLH